MDRKSFAKIFLPLKYISVIQTLLQFHFWLLMLRLLWHPYCLFHLNNIYDHGSHTHSKIWYTRHRLNLSPFMNPPLRPLWRSQEGGSWPCVTYISTQIGPGISCQVEIHLPCHHCAQLCGWRAHISHWNHFPLLLPKGRMSDQAAHKWFRPSCFVFPVLFIIHSWCTPGTSAAATRPPLVTVVHKRHHLTLSCLKSP